MAFLSIPSGWYSVGKALKRQLFSRIADDLDDLNVRVDALALGAAPVEVFNDVILNASSSSSLTGLTYFCALAGFTVTQVQIEIFAKGLITSGSVSIDVKKGSSLGGTFTSILTTPPTVNFAVDPDYKIATGVLNVAEQGVLQGEYLRLDVTSLPSVTLGKFRVLVYGTI